MREVVRMRDTWQEIVLEASSRGDPVHTKAVETPMQRLEIVFAETLLQPDFVMGLERLASTLDEAHRKLLIVSKIDPIAELLRDRPPYRLDRLQPRDRELILSVAWRPRDTNDAITRRASDALSSEAVEAARIDGPKHAALVLLGLLCAASPSAIEKWERECQKGAGNGATRSADFP